MKRKLAAHTRYIRGLTNTAVRKVQIRENPIQLEKKHPSGVEWITILDVGAGSGGARRWKTILEQKQNAIVYCFEPDPEQFKKLSLSIEKLPEKSRRRIEAVNVAVSNYTSNSSPFYRCNDPSSGSLLPFVTENIKKWKYPPGRYYFNTIETIKVPVITLNYFITKREINRIDFLRVDVQGSSLSVFQGATPKKMVKVKEVWVKVHTTPFEIYKNQTTYEGLCSYLKKCYFAPDNVSYQSRNQEKVLRMIHSGWKDRGGKFFRFKV